MLEYIWGAICYHFSLSEIVMNAEGLKSHFFPPELKGDDLPLGQAPGLNEILILVYF